MLKASDNWKGNEKTVKKISKILSVALALMMLLTVVSSAVTAEDATKSLAKWLKNNISISDAGSEIDSSVDWSVFALARSGYRDLNEDYKTYIKKAVAENFEDIYLSDYARISLAVMSVGLDPTDISGKDLIDAICKTDFSKEMFTGSISYALIAIDAAESDNDSVRSALKKAIIGAQRQDGGFNTYINVDPLNPYSADSDADNTGIALQALAPYKNEDDVKTVVNKAVDYIKANQCDDGGFGYFGSTSAESISMIMCGLVAAGIDPMTVTKDGKNMLDALLTFVNTDGGGYYSDWVTGAKVSNALTSYEMLQALNAKYRFDNKRVGLYDMSCLLPDCNSVAHSALLSRIPAFGRFLDRIIVALSGIFGFNYVSCLA